MTRFAYLLAGCLMMAAPMPLAAQDKPAPAVKAETYAKVYDVRDITMPIQDFPAPEIGLGKREAAKPAEEKEAPPTTDDLIDTIEATVEPDVWGTKGFSIKKFKGTLIISASAEVHRKIRALLAQL